MPVPKEIAEKLTGTWKVGLFETPCAAPGTFCYSCWCPCCKAYSQRNEILDLTREPYVCCGGLCPCGPLGDPQSDRSCLFAEVCCCLSLAIAGNRYMLQTRFDRMNTPCDDFILLFTCMVAWVVCILRMFTDIPDEIQSLVDLLICSVEGCMQTQQDIELKEIARSVVYNGAPPHVYELLPDNMKQVVVVYAAPPQQQMHMMGHPQMMQQQMQPMPAQVVVGQPVQQQMGGQPPVVQAAYVQQVPKM